MKGNVTFEIGDYFYTLSVKNFWVCPKSYCFFKFNHNYDGNCWTIGGDFYSEYDILFDYEKAKIHFYSNGGVERMIKSTIMKKPK